MSHVEAIELRRLMSASGLDPSFGDNGVVTLRGVGMGDAVVSFPGGYFVEAHGAAANAPKGVDYLYKLTTGGAVDTTFGDGGRVAVPSFGVDQLAYDKRYGLLYAAGVTKRFTESENYPPGNTAVLRVRRWNGVTGDTDVTFGDAGLASFAFGRTNTSIAHLIDVGRLLPLAKRGLAVAFDHTSFQAPPSDDYYSETRHTIDVTLLKFDADSTRDAAFARRGVANVASGYDVFSPGFVSNYEQFDSPDFQDLQARADGSFRVLTSRRRGASDTANDDEAYVSEKVNFLVTSQVLSPAGVFDASQEHTWRVAKTATVAATGYEPGSYRLMALRAVGDDGAVAVGAIDHGDYAGDPSLARFTTMTPDRRSTARLPRLDRHDYDAVLPFARGYYVVAHDYTLQGVRALKLKSDFRPVPGHIKDTVTPTPNTDPAYAVDIDGRLLLLNGNQISRITG